MSELAERSSEGLRAQGNEAFKEKDFGRAVELYTLAIGAAEAPSAALHSNRAAAYSGLGNFQEALEDAERAIAIDPSWPKGWYRKAAALEALNRPMAAHRAYTEALGIEGLPSPERKTLQRMASKAYAAAMSECRNVPVEDREHFAELYRQLTDQREKLSTLAHFWNLLDKARRHGVLVRFLQIMAGPNARHQPPPLDGVKAEDMRDLPMENYADVERVQVWMDFFAALSADAQRAVLEDVWNSLSAAERGLVVKDLRHFFLPGGGEGGGADADGEEPQVRVVEESRTSAIAGAGSAPAGNAPGGEAPAEDASGGMGDGTA